ncbi:ABC-type transport auxiliary lipoprotein family protein [Halomonas halocynthiae]|uniref:ABC-type transport auxiliary lipoprotein family protein n=1 Tax=Halomonas halocynthiae TaxID=176290 RepID=UPI0004162F8E|nr:ABC-type transport auxiliary lipoprotein family protein [Halomonas halocynthiae]
MTQPIPSTRRIPVAALLTALAISLLLSACNVLPRATPLRTFTLPDASLAAPTQASHYPADSTLSLTLRVDTPNANALLDGVRMLVQPDSEEIQVYGGTRWKDRAPVLIQNRLISALRQDGRLQAVISSNSPASSNVLLSSTLTGFQSRYNANSPDTPPDAVIELDAQLIDSGRGRVIATQRFSVRQAASDESVEAVVRAFGNAASQLDQQVVEWTITQLNHRSVRP